MKDCPTPTKRKFDEEAARAHVDAITSREPRAARSIYKCRCGFWHVANLDGQRRRRSRERKGRR